MNIIKGAANTPKSSEQAQQSDTVFLVMKIAFIFTGLTIILALLMFAVLQSGVCADSATLKRLQGTKERLVAELFKTSI